MESQYTSYVLMGEGSIPPMSSAISSSKNASKLNEPRPIPHSQMPEENEQTEGSFERQGLSCMLLTHLRNIVVKLQSWPLKFAISYLLSLYRVEKHHMNGGLGGNCYIGTYLFRHAWHIFRSARKYAKGWIRWLEKACSLATQAVHRTINSTIRLNADFLYHEMLSSCNPHHIIC